MFEHDDKVFIVCALHDGASVVLQLSRSVVRSLAINYLIPFDQMTNNFLSLPIEKRQMGNMTRITFNANAYARLLNAAKTQFATVCSHGYKFLHTIHLFFSFSFSSCSA